MIDKYVLFIEHDYAEHEVSIHDSVADLEAALIKRFRTAVDLTLLADPLAYLSERNEHVRAYICCGEGVSFACALFSREKQRSVA